MLIPILFSIVYLIACFGVASTAKDKIVGSQRTFHIAVLLTPLVAFLVVKFSSKKLYREIQLIHCKQCNYEYSDNQGTCPACVQKRLNIFVNKSIQREVSVK